MSEAKTTTRPSKTRAPIVSRLTIPATRLRDMVNGVMPAVLHNDVTPILATALWTVEKNSLRLTATDRYRIHTAAETDEVRTSGNPGQFIVPRSALMWLSKNANYFGRTSAMRRMFQPVILAEFRAGRPGTAASVTFRVRAQNDDEFELSLTESLFAGHFPPVLNLVEAARAAGTAAPTRLRLDYLADAQKLAASRFEAPLIKFTDDAQGRNAQPALIQFADEARMGGAPYGEALIQSMTEIRP